MKELAIRKETEEKSPQVALWCLGIALVSQAEVAAHGQLAVFLGQGPCGVMPGVAFRTPDGHDASPWCLENKEFRRRECGCRHDEEDVLETGRPGDSPGSHLPLLGCVTSSLTS